MSRRGDAIGVNRFIKVDDSRIARNTVINLTGELLPMLVALVSMPFILRGLGRDGFGVLALAWAVLGYFSRFDLGMGRATTKFVAEYLAGGREQEIQPLIRNSILITGLIGILGGIALAASAPILSERIFNIPTTLVTQSKNSFYTLALMIPIVTISKVFRGVLAAAQRFDLINFVKIPTSASNYLIPAAAAFLNIGLVDITILLLIVRLIGTIIYFLLNIRVLSPINSPSSHKKRIVLLRSKRSKINVGSKSPPEVYVNPNDIGSSRNWNLRTLISARFRAPTLRPLLTYAGWTTVITFIGPIILYLDRFLIGSLLPVVALSYYTIAYEMVVRLWIVPSSLNAALLPATSSLGAIAAREELRRLFARSVKYLLLALGPMVLVIVLFAHDFFHLWLGADFAQYSAPVSKILCAGILINSLGWVPASFLMGLGRPDVRAKLLLLELPIYAGFAFILVRSMGIIGAAIAWAVIMAMEALLLFVASWKLFAFSPSLLAKHGLLRTLLLILILVAATAGVVFLFRPLLLRGVAVGILLVAFAFVAWQYVLEPSERMRISLTVRNFTHRILAR